MQQWPEFFSIIPNTTPCPTPRTPPYVAIVLIEKLFYVVRMAAMICRWLLGVQ